MVNNIMETGNGIDFAMNSSSNSNDCFSGSSSSSNSINEQELELEWRKDQFRKATKAYFEQAEKEYRRIIGFGSSCRECEQECEQENARKLRGTRTAKTPFKRLKRQRSQMMMATAAGNVNDNDHDNANANNKTASHAAAAAAAAAKPVHKPELELELAQCLLESHYKIVELAIEEYLSSIRKFDVRLVVVQQHEHQQQPQPQQYQERQRQRARYLQQHQQVCGGNLYKNIQSRLQRHHIEAVEEQHIAMASAMVAVREAKITEDFAKKIHYGIDSVVSALRNAMINNGINNHHNHTTYSTNNNNHNPITTAAAAAATFPTTQQQQQQQQLPPQDVSIEKTTDAREDHHHHHHVWDRTVFEALILDGYYRWFRSNNGVLLLIGNNNSEQEVEVEVEVEHQEQGQEQEQVKSTNTKKMRLARDEHDL